jgi:hypothetical protein
MSRWCPAFCLSLDQRLSGIAPQTQHVYFSLQAFLQGPALGFGHGDEVGQMGPAGIREEGLPVGFEEGLQCRKDGGVVALFVEDIGAEDPIVLGILGRVVPVHPPALHRDIVQGSIFEGKGHRIVIPIADVRPLHPSRAAKTPFSPKPQPSSSTLAPPLGGFVAISWAKPKALGHKAAQYGMRSSGPKSSSCMASNRSLGWLGTQSCSCVSPN